MRRECFVCDNKTPRRPYHSARRDTPPHTARSRRRHRCRHTSLPPPTHAANTAYAAGGTRRRVRGAAKTMRVTSQPLRHAARVRRVGGVATFPGNLSSPQRFRKPLLAETCNGARFLKYDAKSSPLNESHRRGQSLRGLPRLAHHIPRQRLAAWTGYDRSSSDCVQMKVAESTHCVSLIFVESKMEDVQYKLEGACDECAFVSPPPVRVGCCERRDSAARECFSRANHATFKCIVCSGLQCVDSSDVTACFAVIPSECVACAPPHWLCGRWSSSAHGVEVCAALA